MRISHRIAAIFLSVSFFLLLFTPLLRAEAGFTIEVTGSNINIRADSTTSSAIICKANKGEQLDVVFQLYDWYQVRLPKKAPAFIKKNLIGKIENLPVGSFDKLNDAAPQVCPAKVLKDRVNIRLAPSESSVILGKVNKDEIVTILEDVSGWYKIEPPASASGWINKKFARKINIIDSARIAGAVPKEEIFTAVIPSDQNSGIVGIIKPYGMVFKRAATHKLETSDGNVLLLKGDKDNLDALNYHKVRISGKISVTTGKKQKYPILEVAKIEEID